MPDNDDYVMKPVLEGMCLYENIKACLIDLEDIAKMNDALDVKAENEKRYQRANEE